ncbi:MAG: hypothetical protein FWF22_06460 [Treponema sp.]|nr:hypothetical protein [Treponema sp.]
MKTLTCDVCRHAIQQPVVNRNYFHVAHRDLCEPCHDELEAAIKPIIRGKTPFSYEWYTPLVQESIEKAIQKGKF